MKYTQISLKLPEEVLDKIDYVAKSRYKKRSEIIREAIVAYVGGGGKTLSCSDWTRKFRSVIVDMGPTNAAKDHDAVL